MSSLRGKTVIITGASRGIGRAIALRLATEGANIVAAAKTVDDSDQKLKGTIHDVVDEVEAAGGHGLAVQVDVREDDQIEAMVARAVERFGGIDVMINNAGAIKLMPVEMMPVKRFDLLWQINVRASYACAHACLPHLKRSEAGAIITMSPPVNLRSRWIGGQTGYTITKYGMTLLAMGLAQELEDTNVHAYALWPKTGIATAAIEWIGGQQMLDQCRKPEIMADAVHALLTDRRPSRNGKALIDEQILREAGVTDFEPYAVKPGAPLMPDFYLDSDDDA